MCMHCRKTVTTLLIVLTAAFTISANQFALAQVKPADAEPAADDQAADDEGFYDEQLPPEAEAEKPKYFSFDIGTKGNYSKGGAPSNLYMSHFIDGEFTYKWFTLSAGYTFVGHYQLSDAAGDYSKIYYHQPKLGVGFNIKDIVTISGEYQLSTGQQKYLSHSVTPSIDIEYKKFYMNTNAGFTRTQYGYANSVYNWLDPFSATQPFQPGKYNQYEKNKVKRKGWSFGFTPGVYVHKKVSLELGFSHSEEYTESLSTSGLYYLISYGIIPNPTPGLRLIANSLVNKTIKYYSNTVSLGTTIRPIEQLSLQGAVNIGKDSAKYVTAGADLGFTIKLFKMIKISFTYTPTHYTPPKKSSYENLKEKGAELREKGNYLAAIYGPLHDWSPVVSDYYYNKYANTRGNPDLSETSGKAYWAQNLNFGVTYSY